VHIRGGAGLARQPHHEVVAQAQHLVVSAVPGGPQSKVGPLWELLIDEPANREFVDLDLVHVQRCHATNQPRDRARPVPVSDRLPWPLWGML
jgi:hypothetical protein